MIVRLDEAQAHRDLAGAALVCSGCEANSAPAASGSAKRRPITCGSMTPKNGPPPRAGETQI